MSSRYRSGSSLDSEASPLGLYRRRRWAAALEGELHLARPDRSAVDEQAALPVEAAADSFDAVDPDTAAAQEVARADAVEDRVQAAAHPRVVVPFEPGEQVGEQRRPVALDIVDGAERRSRNAGVLGQLLACLVDVDADAEHDDPFP